MSNTPAVTEAAPVTRPADAFNRPELMKNAQGFFVPRTKVKDEDLLEDDMVRSLMGTARELKDNLAALKARALSECRAFQSLLGDHYGVTKGGTKGNVTFTSFDGLAKVEIKVQDRLTFGPALQVAKDLIDEFIMAKLAGSDDDIAALVVHAFQVDKEGNISVDRILGLQRMKITHPKWQQAMEAIRDAIRVTDTTAYIRFYQRRDADERWQAVSLDIAKL